jgi:hypothetical protein
MKQGKFHLRRIIQDLGYYTILQMKQQDINGGLSYVVIHFKMVVTLPIKIREAVILIIKIYLVAL